MQICGGVIIALCLGCLHCPPSLTLLFTQPWWHALFLTDSSGQPQSGPALVTFSAEGEVVRYFFLLVSANHADMVAAFLSLLFPNLYTFRQTCDDHAVNLCFFIFVPWHCFLVVLFSQIFVYSCFTLGFQPLTKANDRPSRNDIRVAATCPSKNA